MSMKKQRKTEWNKEYSSCRSNIVTKGYKVHRNKKGKIEIRSRRLSVSHLNTVWGYTNEHQKKHK